MGVTWLRFDVRFTGPPEQLSQQSGPLVSKVTFYHADGTPWQMKQDGGGGGGGVNSDGTVAVNENFHFRLLSPVSAGKKQHIVAVVTFNKALGITTPVRFEMEIEPREGIQG